MKTTYMDYSATTYVKPEVLDAMMPFFTEKFGNPSSFYGISRETKMAVDNARAQVAKAINCDPNEVYFTGGGSEADNWAIKGIATAHMKKGNHIITSKIEHHGSPRHVPNPQPAQHQPSSQEAHPPRHLCRKMG